MNRIFVLMAVILMGLPLLNCASRPAEAQTTERTWFMGDVAIKNTKSIGYIKVNASDVLTITLKSGHATDSYQPMFYMDLFLGIYPVNYTDDAASMLKDGTLMTERSSFVVPNGNPPHWYELDFYGSPGINASMRMGGYDIMRIEIPAAGAGGGYLDNSPPGNTVYNFNITREIPDIFDMNATLASTVEKLDSNLSRIDDLASRINDSINSTNQNISQLNASVNALNASVTAALTAIGGTINALGASTNAALNALGASLDRLNATFTDALDSTKALINAINSTFTANLQSLWSSHLENLTATSERMQSDYESLMAHTNRSFDLLTQNLNALDAYARALNASFSENRSLIEAYMAFTNASIDLLNGELQLLSVTEKNDTQAIMADLDLLNNYTVRANDLLTGLILLADANSSARDAVLDGSVRELRTMTGDLTIRAGEIENRVDQQNRTLTNDLNAEMLRLNFLYNGLKDGMKANQTRMDKQISDAKKEGQNNLGLAVVATFIAACCITWVGISVYDRSHKERGHPEGERPNDEEE